MVFLIMISNFPKVEEFKDAIIKIVRSHAVNELYGARVFDEPAIALAPNPYAKWLTCRVAMEEYGHHVRFKELGDMLKIPEADMTPEGKNPLSIFEFPLETWAEFCVIKLLADFHTMSFERVLKMKPWLLAVIFDSPRPITPFNLDNLLRTKARDLGLKIKGLETSEEHFQVLDNFSVEEQVNFLKKVLDKSLEQKFKRVVNIK